MSELPKCRKDKWVAVAKNLVQGETRRIHCCGKDRSLMVGVSTSHWWCNCFRCGGRDRVPREELSLQELQERKRTSSSWMTAKSIHLPADFTEEIPMAGRLWLYMASLHASGVQKLYGIGWSDSLQRVVIPIRMNSTLKAVVARAVKTGHKPKYLTRQEKKGTVCFSLQQPRLQSPRTLVVVEDLLSMIRVGKFLNTCAALGTWVSAGLISDILDRRYTHVVSWFDSDGAGAKAFKGMGKAMALQGIKTTKINTLKDPKKYSDREIQVILKERL